MGDREHFEPGDDATDFTLADYRGIVEGVRSLVKPPVVAPLEWANDALHLAFVEGFWALLSGDNNPYSMKEQYGSASGKFARRVRSCTGCAYEVNAELHLNGKMIWLEPGAPGEYVGQWIGDGSPSFPPPPSCKGSSACAVVTDLGTGLGKEGLDVSVVFSNPAGPPSTVTVTGTTDADGVFCAAPPVSGSLTGNPLSVIVATSLGATLTVQPSYNATAGRCEAKFDFCERKLVAYAYDGDAGDPGPGGGMAATLGGVPGFGIGGQVPDGSVVPASGVGVVNSGASVEYTRQELKSPGTSAVSSAGVIPNYVAAYAPGYYGYYNCCLGGFDGCAPCGGTVNLPIVLWSVSSYVWRQPCDPRCLSIGGQDTRKVVTRKDLFATWSGPGPIFGDDAGAPVAIHWDPSSWDGRNDHSPGSGAMRWMSACSASGSYGGCITTSTNNCISEINNFNPSYPDRVVLSLVPYGSRRIVMTIASGGFLGGGSGITYTNYWNGSCNPTDPAPLCFGSVAGGNAVFASPMGYCPDTRTCPPYSTRPAPTGPTETYPKSVAFSGGPACQEVMDFELSEHVVPAQLDCDWTYGVVITE